MNPIPLLLLFGLIFSFALKAQEGRPRELGIQLGVLQPGQFNAITDVKGVSVGHFTLSLIDSVNTGVTAILPHTGNIFQEKVPAAMYIGNGFGKLMGYSQVEELGNIETPIILTNTLGVPTAANGLITYTLAQPENQEIRSVNPIVGETNDGRLNAIRNRPIKETHILKALSNAHSGAVKEGNVGAGTGTMAFGFKGGIGSSSRKLPDKLGGYTVGVLVQTNFGGILQIDGAPVGRELGQFYLSDQLDYSPDGSCMIIVATDAPVDARNLKRIAKRAMLGLAKTGGIASNGSGDYVIAFSTHPDLRIPYQSSSPFLEQKVLRNSAISPLFLATIEATEEAIINSLFAAKTIKYKKRVVKALPIEKVLEIMNKYQKVKPIKK